MPRSIDELPWLTPGAPFPAPTEALDDPNGLLAIGGSLDPDTLLRAYRAGIFPWFSDDQPILWWSPNPRMVIRPHQLHVSRSLRKQLNRDRFHFSIDQAFAAVMLACAEPRDAVGGTWITDDMLDAYQTLHQLGHAHSLEVWRDGELCGGLYGIHLGGVFFGESMFSRERDASKCAFALLCALAPAFGIALIDGQVESLHLERLGANALPRDQFLAELAPLVDRWGWNSWSHPPAPLAEYRRTFRLEVDFLAGLT